MKYKILPAIIFILFSCDNIIKDEVSSYDLIPENTEILISVKNLNKFKSILTDNEYLNAIVNSNSTIKNLTSQLFKISSDKEVLIGLYEIRDTLYYSIIGAEISNDSINSERIISYENIDIITNNSSIIPEPQYVFFGKKFEKIKQTNTNFSVSLDSLRTKDFLSKIFNDKITISNGNLILNVDGSSNLISINGVIDNYSLNIEDDLSKIDIQEIVNTDEGLFFNYETDLIDEYDLISTNQEKKFNFFNLDSNELALKKYKIFQLKKGDNVANINGLISDYKKEAKNSNIDLKFETSFSNEIIFGPIIVKNYITNKNEVLAQDSKNTIFLINDNGQIEWSKKIDGKIIGEITQIDSYKNGRLQYVFATNKSLNLIDRKGRDVGKFPLKFNDNITQPLSVFDYDKNKNYRLLITQKNELFMFDSKGNRVKGFDYSGESRIITQPRHYRISNKDIIVFKTSDNLSILNRRGKIRIKPDENYDYSNEDIFQYKNLLITTSDKNEIISIDMSGRTKLEESMSFDIKMISDKKTIYTLQKNILSNSKKNTEIQFGKYESFSVISDKKNTFINIFDSQNKKLYLFDDEINIIKGFPILADTNANFILENNKIEFSVISDSKKIKYFLIK